MDTKRRRHFRLENADGDRLASGVLYDEGNVQILWRADSEWTAEQYSDIGLVLDLMPGVSVLRLLTDADIDREILALQKTLQREKISQAELNQLLGQ